MLEFIENGDFIALKSFIIIRTSIIMVCWACMSISCLIDLWSGRDTARALGERLESHKYRKTFVKMGDYARVMLFGLMFDLLGFLLPFYKLPFAIILCTVSIILIEGKSVIENSQRKKAHAGKIPEVVKQIMQAVSQKDAEMILEQIKKK